jgi:hypothetical protein
VILPIDLRAVIPVELLAALSEDAIDAIMQDIANGARHEWIRLAGKRLAGSAPDYLRGIQEVKFGRGTATITLLGEQANRLEQGHPRIEQKYGLLGPRVPVTEPPAKGKRQRYRWERRGNERVRVKDGYYRAVPFRHATPGTRGQVGTPMGEAYREALGPKSAKQLGRAVYAAAKELAPSRTQPYGGATEWGERLDTAGLVYGKKQKPVDVPKLREYHTVDIYAGMYRMEKTYERATQGYYQTFRMIAVDASGELVNGRDKKTGRGKPKDPRSWVIPAKEGVHVAKDVQSYVEKISVDSFRAYVEAMR